MGFIIYNIALSLPHLQNYQIMQKEDYLTGLFWPKYVKCPKSVSTELKRRLSSQCVVDYFSVK